MTKLMFSLFCSLLFIVFSGCEKVGEPPPPPTDPPKDEWELVWSDEFNGSALDKSIWVQDDGGFGWGNNELQYYRAGSSNTYMDKGNLVLVAKKENFQGKSYTSSRMHTWGTKEFLFGKIEVRAKLPKGQGIWPAIWLFPFGREFPRSGEIDIMELVGHKANEVWGHVHFGNSETDRSYEGEKFVLDNTTFSDDFHNFSIEWERDKIQWFVDGKLFFTITPQTVKQYHYPFNDEKFHLILNIAVGGNWPGSPNSSTVFPQEMRLDYVRYYKKKDKQ